MASQGFVTYLVLVTSLHPRRHLLVNTSHPPAINRNSESEQCPPRAEDGTLLYTRRLRPADCVPRTLCVALCLLFQRQSRTRTSCLLDPRTATRSPPLRSSVGLMPAVPYLQMTVHHDYRVKATPCVREVMPSPSEYGRGLGETVK